MITYRINVADEVQEQLEAIAIRRKINLDELIRRSIELFCIADTYLQEGKTLVWFEEGDTEPVHLHIPGLS